MSKRNTRTNTRGHTEARGEPHVFTATDKDLSGPMLNTLRPARAPYLRYPEGYIKPIPLVKAKGISFVRGIAEILQILAIFVLEYIFPVLFLVLLLGAGIYVIHLAKTYGLWAP